MSNKCKPGSIAAMLGFEVDHTYVPRPKYQMSQEELDALNKDPIYIALVVLHAFLGIGIWIVILGVLGFFFCCAFAPFK